MKMNKLQNESHFTPKFKPKQNLLRIPPYVGGDITPLGMVRRIALASNENPFGPCQGAIEAVKTNLHRLQCYPSGNATILKQALSDLYDVSQDNLVCGTGSEEIIHLLSRAYVGSGDEIIFNQYGFLVYKIAALSVGATPIPVSQSTLSIDVDAILRAVTEKTRLIFLDNPANPLGCFVPYSEIVRLHQALPPSVILVLDAAYAEYMEDQEYSAGLDLAKQYPNVVMTRTFSKIYGLANLRIGWAYCDRAIVEVLDRIRQPFNVNGLGQVAAVAALQDQAWVKQVYTHTRTWRHKMEKELTKMGIEISPCFTNFVLIKFPGNAEAAYQFLGQRGIIVRPLKGYGLPDYLRITIGLENEMIEVLELLREFVG